MRILKGKDIITDKWEQLYKSSSFATFFQSPDCYRFYKELSFMSPFVYAVEEEGMIKALVCGYLIAEKGFAKSYFSRRAIIPGGVLLADNVTDEEIGLLLSTVATDLRKKAIYIEVRNLHDYSVYKDVFQKADFEYQAHLNYQISIHSGDEVFANFSDNRKRQIKQSITEGLVCEETSRIEDIQAFFRVLQKTYNKKLKLPLFPFEFFETIVSKANGHLLVVKNKGKILGGILCVGDHKVLYEWFVCGDDGAQSKVYPSVMATYAGIEYALKGGYQMFDFMGAGKPDKKYGVRDFKARFGGTLVEHGRFLYICSPFLYFAGKSAIMLRKLF
ncbi:MAG: GNAT family N-acetyltransferase [Paludibacter sp.]|jgi:hypothetical protein|nr:GNAT family N-acetyltransferase [Paludibacter sp.]